MHKFKQTGRRHNPANGLLQHKSIKDERTADAGYARGIFYSRFLSFSNKFSSIKQDLQMHWAKYIEEIDLSVLLELTDALMARFGHFCLYAAKYDVS